MKLKGLFSVVVRGVISLTKIGASLMGLTVTVKVSSTVLPLDVPSIVISAVPD